MNCGMSFLILFTSSNFLQTNIPFLINVMQHDRFLTGSVDTYFIGNVYDG